MSAGRGRGGDECWRLSGRRRGRDGGGERVGGKEVSKGRRGLGGGGVGEMEREEEEKAKEGGRR